MMDESMKASIDIYVIDIELSNLSLDLPGIL